MSKHKMDLHKFAHQMPKVELHVHLEGAIRPATLLQLAQRNGVRLPLVTSPPRSGGFDDQLAWEEKALRDFYHFRDFAHFVEVYVTITGCLRTPDDYRLIAYEFGSDCARQNIRYAEVTFTIATNVRPTGLRWQAILEGLNAGRAQAHADFGVDWRWVFDISRDNPATQDQVVEIALAARDQGVVALGLGGSEADFPPAMFKRTFARARQAGLPSVPHAGETAGPDSIWAALQSLHADRLGHGVRCVEDSALVEYLREHQVPLEICPTSNICLGVYSDYSRHSMRPHPLRQLWDAGLLVTVNSDDPALFDTDLNHEYEILVDHFGFDADELEQVSLNGLHASFLSPAEKTRLKAEFRTQFAQLRVGLLE